MKDQSVAGGLAGWSGADFELRLGVEFCVYMLVRELCAEGETLYADMGDEDKRAFFQGVQRALSQAE
jgi:hypothetical protein